VIDVAQRFEDMAAFGRNIRGDVDDVPAGMTEAVRQDHREGLRGIARQRVAHLNRGPEAGRTMGQDRGQVLARVPAAREKQRDAMAVARRDDPRGADARAIR